MKHAQCVHIHAFCCEFGDSLLVNPNKVLQLAASRDLLKKFTRAALFVEFCIFFLCLFSEI